MTARRPPELGRFELVRELGRGGMGVVYEVRDPRLPERQLALKVLAPTADAQVLARFAREAESLARVRHVGVVAVHEHERSPRGEPYLLTDLVPGRDLAAHVAAAGRPAPRAAATLVRDLADALAAVHAAGVVHRDLKPQNVIIRPDGSPVLIDFGLARAEEMARLTAAGTVLGTLSFMAPEQADGAAVDARADVYGLGAIFYWLLTGRAPFSGPPVQVLHALFHTAPPWPAEIDPSVPPALDALCRRAMAKAPADRPQDAPGLRDELTAWLAGEAPAPRGGPAPRRPIPTVLALGAAVAVAAAAALIPRARQEAPPITARPASPSPLAAGSGPQAAPAPDGDDKWRAPFPAHVWEPPAARVKLRAVFLDDDRLLVVSEELPSLFVLDVTAGFPPSQAQEHPLDVKGRDAAATPSGPLVLTTEALCRWDGRTLHPLWRTATAAWSPRYLDVDATGARAVVADLRTVATRVLGLPGGEVERELAIPEGDAHHTRGVAFAGARVVQILRTTNDRAGLLVSWAPGATRAGRLELPSVDCLAVHPDGALAAVGLRDGGKVALCAVDVDPPVRRQVVQLDLLKLAEQGSNGRVHACAFGAGHLWATTRGALWRLPLQADLSVDPARQRTTPLPARFDQPSSIDVSPDGALVAVCSEAGQVLLVGVDAP